MYKMCYEICKTHKISQKLCAFFELFYTLLYFISYGGV